MAIKNLNHLYFITYNMETTVRFYMDIIGLVRNSTKPIDTNGTEYLYIKGQSSSILHIARADKNRKQKKFYRLASLDNNTTDTFTSGSIDHFCLAFDYSDYSAMLLKLNKNQIDYNEYHNEVNLKQIYILDPNGIRVELNFELPTSKEAGFQP